MKPPCIQWVSRQSRRWLVVVILAAASFGLGFWASDRRMADKVDEAAQRRIGEFVRIADSLGILDRRRLEEVLASMTEGRDDTSQSERDPRRPRQ